MLISIVTPSFRHSEWLKLCIASVADQKGVDVEHIVQDAGSDDGTLDWLPHDNRVKVYVEKDNGMYDAVNRGLKRSKGEVLAYLNCDEQFLPDALKSVHDFFLSHPQTEVVFAGTVVVDAEGQYICNRKSLLPLSNHLWYRLPTLTCATFFRRSVLDQHSLYFDTKWRDLGDLFWVMELLRQDIPMAVLGHFTSAFTVTGDNMNFKPNALREKQTMREMTPKWIRGLKFAIIGHHRLRSLINGRYFQKPFTYSIYSMRSPDKRVALRVLRPTPFWRIPPTQG